MRMFTEAAVAKFWTYVDTSDTNGCWIWTGGRNNKGYGQVNLDRMNLKAHRAVMMMKLGKDIASDIHVCHHCDTPPCVNPAHLFLGSPLDNMRDKVAKGRSRYVLVGEFVTNSKMTDDLVKRLLWKRVNGADFSELSREFQLDKKTVTMICRGESWPHIIGSAGAPTMSQLLAVPLNTRPSAKIDELQASQIMKLLSKGRSGKSIAKEFGIHFATVSNIKTGEIWSHLAGINGNPTVQEMVRAIPQSIYTSKLNEAQATEVKHRLVAGEAPTAIAKSMGVSPGAIYHIKQGRTWSEIDIGVDLMALPLQKHGSRR